MKFTKTSEFIFPLLGIRSNDLYLPKPRFFNCYLNDERIDKDFINEPYVIVVHPGVLDRAYDAFDKKMISYPNYVESYDVTASGSLIGRIYKIPTEFISDFEKFKQGKYSEFSVEAKHKIIDNSITKKFASDLFVKINKEDAKNQTAIEMIFSKHPFLKKELEKKFEVTVSKDQELWSKPDTDINEVNLENFEKEITVNGKIIIETHYELSDIITKKLIKSLEPAIVPSEEFKVDEEEN